MSVVGYDPNAILVADEPESVSHVPYGHTLGTAEQVTPLYCAMIHNDALSSRGGEVLRYLVVEAGASTETEWCLPAYTPVPSPHTYLLLVCACLSKSSIG